MNISKMEPKSTKKNIVFEWNYFLLALISITMQHATMYNHHLHYYNFAILFMSIIIVSYRLIISYYRRERVKSPFKRKHSSLLIIAVIVFLSIDLFYTTAKVFYNYSAFSAISMYSPLVLYAYMFGLLSVQRYSDPRNEVSIIFKTSLYSAIEMAFYCGFVPIRFFHKKDTLILRTQELLSNVLFIFLRTFIYMLSHQYYSKIGELSIHTQIMGKWTKISNTSSKIVSQWMEGVSYVQGSVVKEKGELYEAVGLKNSSRPGDTMCNVLYALYSQPANTLRLMGHSIYMLIVVEFVMMLWLKCYAERAIGMLISMFIFFQILNDRDKLSKHERCYCLFYLLIVNI